MPASSIGIFRVDPRAKSCKNVPVALHSTQTHENPDAGSVVA